MKRHRKGIRMIGAALIGLALSAGTALADRQMETLGRGVVAIDQGEVGVFVSWRLLATDAEPTAFNVYRIVADGQPERLNDAPLTGPTHFIDTAARPDGDVRYFVRPVVDGVEGEESRPFVLTAGARGQPYLSVPIQTPPGYTANDASVGDLDGDGEYEIVLHMTGRAHDNSHAGETDPPIFHAYKLDGTLLWSINLGRNIREGAHYTQFMVYDLDGDGRAEIVMKTADGTTDSAGTVIGDADADHRNERGYILKGPEFLTVFDGLTGRALATTDYIPPRHPDTTEPTEAQLKEIWGDGYGNRCDRFLAAVAYLDGERPSVVMCRGYYTRTVLAAFDWRDGKLTHRWTFDSHASEANRPYAGQGNHNLSVADVDGDGRDEIIYGGMTIDDNGQGLYTTGLGHGDAMHVSDLDPERPGLEVFRIQEPFADAGAHLFDARTGEVLWRKPSVSGGRKQQGPGRGVAFDVDPRYPGAECWVAGGGIEGMFDIRGNVISPTRPSVNMAVWWDGDLLRELLDGTHIDKWDYEQQKPVRLLSGEEYNCEHNNGTKANPCLSADILGDWREEVIWRTADNTELRIFTTTIPTEYRFVTLMHDPVYRLGVVWQNVAYNQPPHTSFFLGHGMTLPPASHGQHAAK